MSLLVFLSCLVNSKASFIGTEFSDQYSNSFLVRMGDSLTGNRIYLSLLPPPYLPHGYSGVISGLFAAFVLWGLITLQQ